MKLKVENKRVTFMSLFLATAILAGAGVGSTKAMAQDDVLDQAEDALSDSGSLDMDQIDIDGKLSPSELMKRRREKLEERNKIMVEKKIEDIRVKQEIALTNKLQGAFNAGLNNLNEDKVQVAQAAPAAPAPVAPAPVVETRIIEVPAPVEKVEKKSKIIPSLGASNIKGDRVDLDSDLTLNISAETMVAPQISVGVNIGYTSLKMTDVANQFINNGYGNVYNYNNVYYNTYGTGGREMSLKKYGIEATGKFFFIEDAMIKPYVGAGLGLSRSSLKYENQSTVYTNGYNFGSEDYSSSTVAGSAKIGAEASFTDTVGANLEVSYAKNISSGISKSSELSASTNPDQGRLENIQRDIEDGSVVGIQAGLVIKF